MVITQTPLRVSLGGGGTDFPSFYRKYTGAVISTTIDKYIYVMVKKRFDNKFVAHYRGFEMVDHPSELKHNLIKVAAIKTGVTESVEVSTTADIPSTGSGLGSSSSVLVGLLHALYIYRGILPTKWQLAEEACNIEIEELKSPIGKQDQYAAAFGGINFISFEKDIIAPHPIEIDGYTLNAFEQNLMLFYTGIARSSSQILSKQKDNIRYKIPILKLMTENAENIRNRLQEGNIHAVGKLLSYGWYLKKKMTRAITKPTLNEIYAMGMKAGALGGKICGAGGGGFMLFYCPLEKQDKLRDALKSLQELPFQFDKDGSKTIFNIRR